MRLARTRPRPSPLELEALARDSFRCAEAAEERGDYAEASALFVSAMLHSYAVRQPGPAKVAADRACYALERVRRELGAA